MHTSTETHAHTGTHAPYQPHSSDTACFYTGCSIPTVIKKIRPPIGMFVFIGKKQHDQAHTCTSTETHAHTGTHAPYQPHSSDTACFYTGCSIPTVIKKIRPPVGMFVFIGRKQHDQAHTHAHKHRNARTHAHTRTLPPTLLRHSLLLHRLLNSDSHQEDQTARRYVCLHWKKAA